MKSSFRILLPIDITNCPLEVFSYVNRLADKFHASLTLLHVARKAAAEVNGVQDGSLATLKSHLERLARRFIYAEFPPHFKIRVGLPADEILAEAEEQRADLIILTSRENSSREARPFEPGIRTRILSNAPCKISVVRVRTRFNCEEQWPLVDEIVAALDYVGLLKLSGKPA